MGSDPFPVLFRSGPTPVFDRCRSVVPASTEHTTVNPGTVSLIALVVLAAWSDLRTRRIPNALTITGLIVALLIRSAHGLDAVGTGALGAALAFGVAFPLFALRGLGAGDVKLLAACGAFLGPSRLVIALLVTALLGGLMAIIAVLQRGALRRTLANCGAILTGAWTTSRRTGLPTLATRGAITIPYGVAIAAGALAGWFL